MALTSRGKALVAGGAVVAVLGGGMAALALSGNAPDSVAGLVDDIVPGDQTPQRPCPLTGEMLPGDKAPPDRPVLAVKVENTPDAQPLAGLQGADIVYEEVVEGGITRFVVLFHCDEADRIGPVRSIRSTDSGILAPFSEHPLLAFSGGSKGVRTIVDDAGMAAMDEDSATKAFIRDDSRIVPHNLFTSTKPLWGKGRKLAEGEPAPDSPFTYNDEVPTPSKKARSATVVFSGLATAEWRWAKGQWVRYLEGSPMMLESGGPITADNVVIQVVKTTESEEFKDVAEYPSPEVDLLGEGKAWVLRDGKLIIGKWERSEESGFTIFRTKSGEQITLKPGTTFVELAPKGMFDAEISFT